MRIKLTLLPSIALSFVLVSWLPVMAEEILEPESFSFQEDRIGLLLPAGGYSYFPGDEIWSYSESVVMEWNHDEEPIHRMLLMVDHFESPITSSEFELMVDEYWDSFRLDSFEANNITQLEQTSLNGLDWQFFRMDLEDGGESVVSCVSYLTHVRNRLYTIVFYYEEYWIAEIESGIDPAKIYGFALNRIGEMLGDFDIYPPTAPTDFVLKKYELPQFGISIDLPQEGELLSGDMPELTEYNSGPMQFAFSWSLGTSPAHIINWFVVNKSDNFLAGEWEFFMEGTLSGVAETEDIGSGNFSLVEVGGSKWYWADAGCPDLEFPEENILLFMRHSPNGIEMILVYANNGYKLLAVEQMELLLGTVVLSEREIPRLDTETLELEEFGLAMDFPGGGWFGYPTDEDWEYGEKDQIKFAWVHLDTPVETCRIAVKDIGLTFSESEYGELGLGLSGMLSEQMGGVPVKVLDPQQIGDYLWYGCEFEIPGTTGFEFKSGVYYFTDLNVFYALGFDYKLELESEAKVMIRDLLGTFRIE